MTKPITKKPAKKPAKPSVKPIWDDLRTAPGDDDDVPDFGDGYGMKVEEYIDHEFTDGSI